MQEQIFDDKKSELQINEFQQKKFNMLDEQEDFHSFNRTINLQMSQLINSNSYETPKNLFKFQSQEKQDQKIKETDFNPLSEQILQFNILTQNYKILQSIIVDYNEIQLFKIPQDFFQNDAYSTILLKENNQQHDNRRKQQYQHALQVLLKDRKQYLNSLLEIKSQNTMNNINQNMNRIISMMSFDNIKDQIKDNKQNLKKMLIKLRNSLDKIKNYITIYTEQQRKKSQYVYKCQFCQETFSNGRQLGGHMSRKHSGSSSKYLIKTKIYAAKAIERDRRKYFKKQKKIVEDS